MSVDKGQSTCKCVCRTKMLKKNAYLHNKEKRTKNVRAGRVFNTKISWLYVMSYTDMVDIEGFGMHMNVLVKI